MKKINISDPFVDVFQFFIYKYIFGMLNYTCNFCGASKDLVGGKNVESILRRHLINCAEFNKEVVDLDNIKRGDISKFLTTYREDE